ncbi:MAG: hypothetical protein B7Y11_03470 [Sphingobacteriia bacterium 24-36-13]|jgi:hypothetical protein|uniref:hypothetical protein n=1 Tax=Sediminibacterium sp. TaxID=1917865 RepID=UPI000BD1AD29|nr:hypothetical protein [Sediminibacterium sp.]OYY11562.1 MAG: hypothetical protein B7Y66_02390 [Sphingobacteriia bacterium 35-36-14]OYZ54923.1 MAG: hypothetical protein B7Y11_03470 [Sphingobacteriia bacterium 24-36-13]OZA66129.1 MAG: hypothetical protein B7X68_01525 [Sphingobacteriia bacterium 39-36-14]HQS24007.1 hypothetical protein [Sediminibacterium sp.]HQS34947.1 hypothetical protein [Sediminibacterium sp.]
MLTATDLTGEETHEKKNPRFLLLLLALFIMAGIGYAAFWWIAKQDTITPIVEEKETVDASAQAWYEEQQKLMEAKLNLQPDSAVSSVPIDSAALDATAPDSAAIMINIPPPESTPKIVENTAVVKTEKQSALKIELPAVSPKIVAAINSTPTVVKPLEPKPVRSKKVVDDNIKPSDPTQYFQQDNRKPQYNGSVPPTNNKRPIESEPIYTPVNRPQKEAEKMLPSFNNAMITRAELEEFMQQFPYKKTTIQFVCYTKPNEEMEAVKAQILQFLRQNGYTDMETNWNIWSDHTPVKEVHYGKSGATGANFYIPSFR